MRSEPIKQSQPSSQQHQNSDKTQLQTKLFGPTQSFANGDTIAGDSNHWLEAGSDSENDIYRNFSFGDVNIFAADSTPPPPPGINTPLQAKLTVGAVNDPYEQEADQVAAQVVKQINAPKQTFQTGQQTSPSAAGELQAKRAAAASTQASTTQASPEKLEKNSIPGVLQMKPLTIRPAQPNSLLQRFATVQRVGAEGGAVSDDIESSIERSRGGGSSLDSSIRQPMEDAFGADFSSVRVHTDGTADQLNRSINARAFTTGSDLFFKKGEYQPNSQSGQELLAHELTHVVQQNGSTVQKKSNQQRSSTQTEMSPETSVAPPRVRRSLQRNHIQREWEPMDGQYWWNKLVEDFRWWYNPANNCFYYEKEGPSTTTNTEEIAIYNSYIAREEPLSFWNDLLKSDPLFKNKIPLGEMSMMDEASGEQVVAQNLESTLADQDEADQQKTVAGKVKAFLKAADPDAKANKWRLRAEAVGHLTGGAMLGGFALAGSSFAPPFGLLVGVASGAQILIGLCKGVRSFLKPEDKKMIGGLILLEAAAAATTTGVAAALTMNPALIANAIGNLSKIGRGVAIGTGHANPKVIAVLTLIESAISAVMNIVAKIVEGGAKLVAGVAGVLIGGIKASRARAGWRKAKAAQEAEEPAENAAAEPATA